MLTERQIAALLVAIGAGTAFAFALFNCYVIFKNTNTVYRKVEA